MFAATISYLGILLSSTHFLSRSGNHFHFFAIVELFLDRSTLFYFFDQINFLISPSPFSKIKATLFHFFGCYQRAISRFCLGLFKLTVTLFIKIKPKIKKTSTSLHQNQLKIKPPITLFSTPTPSQTPPHPLPLPTTLLYKITPLQTL